MNEESNISEEFAAVSPAQTQETEKPLKEKRLPPLRRWKPSSLLLLAQSAVCVILLLAVLLLKGIGGALYGDIRGRFAAVMSDNSLAGMVSEWFEQENRATHV